MLIKFTLVTKTYSYLLNCPHCGSDLSNPAAYQCESCGATL